MITLIIYQIRTKSILWKNILFYFMVLIKNYPKKAVHVFLIKNAILFPFLSVPAPIFLFKFLKNYFEIKFKILILQKKRKSIRIYHQSRRSSVVQTQTSEREISGSIQTSYRSICQWFGRNLACHHTNVLGLCWCLVSRSRVYDILSTMDRSQGRILTTSMYFSTSILSLSF